MTENKVLFEGDTAYGHYLVVDTIYSGRPARVLFSGTRQAAQSGEARDDKPELLFDYNERFMELVRGLKPRRILLIGGGAFTLPKALQAELPDGILDVVELDGKLFDIAQAHFDFKPAPQTHVYIGDGREFLQNTSEQYDLILIDAFMHDVVPEPLQTVEAAKDLEQHLRPGGLVAMNIIAAYYGQRSAVLRRQIAAFQTAFSAIQIFPAGRGQSLWIPQNFLLTTQNSHRELQEYLRYEALSVPNVGEDEAIQEDANS
jgi:spermidine synthase